MMCTAIVVPCVSTRKPFSMGCMIIARSSTISPRCADAGTRMRVLGCMLGRVSGMGKSAPHLERVAGTHGHEDVGLCRPQRTVIHFRDDDHILCAAQTYVRAEFRLRGFRP